MDRNKIDENDPNTYLNVTYHGADFTIGEPPVDPKKYPIPRLNFITWEGVEYATVLGQGALELDPAKAEGEGTYITLNGWTRTPSPFAYGEYKPDQVIPVTENIDFYPVFTFWAKN